MTAKWKIEDIAVGRVMQATFWANPVTDSPFLFRATHLDGRKCPKVVLSRDTRIRPGMPCLVRITAVTKPRRDDRGTIEVEFVRTLEFRVEGVWVEPLVGRKLQVLLESGLNILLDGPQGCGKTVLARAIAQTLGMEFIFFNCGAVVDPGDFLASLQIKSSATGAPITAFVPTDVLRALEEAAVTPTKRYLVFLDEFNRCPESARNALMPVLDASRRFFHPIENRFMQIPDNVQFIAAVNRGSAFSATFGIDAAQLDRFAPLSMTYLPPEAEIKLLQDRYPGLGKSLVTKVVHLADKIRKSPELSCGLSVRATEEVCTYLEHPLFEDDRKSMLGEILKSSFCGRFSGRFDDVTSDAGAVWAIINRELADGAAE